MLKEKKLVSMVLRAALFNPSVGSCMTSPCVLASNIPIYKANGCTSMSLLPNLNIVNLARFSHLRTVMKITIPKPIHILHQAIFSMSESSYRDWVYINNPPPFAFLSSLHYHL